MQHDPQRPFGRIAKQIHQKLLAAFAPAEVLVHNDSARHAGHAGTEEGGESHFRVTVISPRFLGLSRLERQREINRVLAEELAGPVHALALTAHTPEEANIGERTNFSS